MSIYFSGTLTRSSGISAAITKQLKLVNLKLVKRISVQFDPFHPNAVTARDFLFHISTPRVLETNLNCLIKPQIVCDRSEPIINVDLIEAGSVKFLAENLSVLEILQHINKHISSTVKPEEPKNIQTAKIEKKQKKR